MYGFVVRGLVALHVSNVDLPDARIHLSVAKQVFLNACVGTFSACVVVQLPQGITKLNFEIHCFAAVF